MIYTATQEEIEQHLSGDLSALPDFVQALSQIDGPRTHRINADHATAEQGLAKLALTLVELIRQLLEKQALRRIDAGSLTDEQIERMGTVFLQLAAKMEDLKAAFNLQDEDLNLDLGPLGNLL